MSFMPSQAYVAEQIFKIGPDEPSWEDAPQEEIDSHMEIARVAIAAIQSWQALHRPDGRSNRYCFELTKDKEGYAGWTIYDRNEGLNSPLGIIHDALLAQQIVDDLNEHDTEKKFEVKA